MTIKNSLLLCALICVAALGYSLIIAPSLPDIVATHWNAQGQIDGRGPKGTMLYLMPGIMVLNLVLLVALPKLSPRKFEIDGFGGAYGSVFVVLQSMMFCLHLVFLQGARNEAIDITRWVMPIMFLFLALMGNWMGKIRQNFYMGIRTPWTLADTQVWDLTHRAASKIYFFGGMIGAILAAFGLPWWLTFGAFMALAMYPVLLSWLIYKKLNP